jgi:hypothetical protein
LCSRASPAEEAGNGVRNRRSPADELRNMPARLLASSMVLLLLLLCVPLLAADADSIRPSETPPSGPLWLRVRGGYLHGGERERAFGVLELGFSLDLRVAGRRAALAAAAGEAPQRSADEPADTPFLAEPPLPSGRMPLPGRRWELDPALARSTLAAASRVADLGAPPAAYDSMLARTRSSAGLPEVRLAAGSSRDQSLRLAPTLTDPGKFTQDGGHDLWFEARLTWRLEHLVFSHDEIAIQRLKAQELENRRRLLRLVLEALVDWQRARLAQRSELLEEEPRHALELRELDALLRLDAWTDGWFSRHLEHTREDAHTRPESSLDREACEPAAGGLQVAHGLGDPTGARRPQAARGCAKGATLTYRNSNAN